MLTTSHMLIGAAATTRPHFKPWQIGLGWLGGFAPDASVVLMVIASRTSGVVGQNLWDKPNGLYWQEPWQTFSAISNSIPMWMLFVVLGYLTYRYSPRYKQLALGLLIFSAAALIHVFCDFLVHADDAHVHFWPLTDWRFHSPVSYYQRNHYGNIFRPFETALDVALAGFLFWRFPQWTVRITALLMAVPPLMMAILAPIMFAR